MARISVDIEYADGSHTRMVEEFVGDMDVSISNSFADLPVQQLRHAAGLEPAPRHPLAAQAGWPVDRHEGDPMTQRVSNGRIVHLNDIIGKCRPLIVSDVVYARVGEPLVSGLAIGPSGSSGPAQSVAYSEEPYDRTVAKQSWHWPERVE